MKDCIENKEVLMSRFIIDNGWNIGAVCNYYNSVDFRFKEKQPHEYDMNFTGDLTYNKYRDKLWNEYQIVFIKGSYFGII
jgi:hypothetical protein